MADSRQNFPGKGRTSWGGAPSGGEYGEKWYNLLTYLEKPKGKKSKEIRPVGGVFTISQHYIKFKTKQGNTSGFYVICPNFDPLSGEFKPSDEASCPICRDFSDSDLPQDLRFYGSYRYYFDAFDVQRLRAGAVDAYFGVVFTNKYGKSDIAKIADSLGNDVDDLANGCTINWYLNEDARDPKERTSFTRGERIPVLYSQSKGLYALDLGGKRYTGQPTDFEGIVIANGMQSPVEIEKSLKRLGLYDRLSEATRSSTAKGRTQSFDEPTSTPTSDPVADDFDSPASSKAETPPGGRNFSKPAAADDDWGAPAAAPTAQTAASKPKSAAKPAAAPPASDPDVFDAPPPAAAPASSGKGKKSTAKPAAASAAPPADDWDLTPASSSPPAAEDLALSDEDKGLSDVPDADW